MQPPLKHTIYKQTLWLCADRCIFWEEQQALILADLHLGKTGHFRKSGIPVPQTVFKEDMQRLVNLIQLYKPTQLIIVGDMFHSESNRELELFSRWRNDFPYLAIHLIKGNHDVLDEQWYNDAGISLYKDELEIDTFIFRHDYSAVLQPGAAGKYFFSGHIHPGICIKGVAKQSVTLPCFHFCDFFCTLPAFSHFTGVAVIKRGRTDNVFAIVNNAVIRINT